MFSFFVKLAIQLGIYNFVIYFEMLILCSCETCVFVLIRFSNSRLDSFVFLLFILINNAGICIILLLLLNKYQYVLSLKK